MAGSVSFGCFVRPRQATIFTVVSCLTQALDDLGIPVKTGPQSLQDGLVREVGHGRAFESLRARQNQKAPLVGSFWF